MNISVIVSLLARKPSIGLFAIMLSFASYCHAETPDPDQVLKRDFWGTVYKDGGETFYCKKAFKSKTALIAESYIYSTSWVRDFLRCGTNRQCKRENERYREIISDLHNIVPADSYIEFKRKSAIFGNLDDSVKVSKCGVRKKFQIFDPDDSLKGDIARAILYMYERYQLPMMVSFPELSRWHEMDPPSPEEQARNTLIESIQGNDNPFISNPSHIENIREEEG